MTITVIWWAHLSIYLSISLCAIFRYVCIYLILHIIYLSSYLSYCVLIFLSIPVWSYLTIKWSIDLNLVISVYLFFYLYQSIHNYLSIYLSIYRESYNRMTDSLKFSLFLFCEGYVRAWKFQLILDLKHRKT